MAVISLVQAKLFLGLTDTSQDSSITAMIPYIDAKVKQICRNDFHKPILCKLTDLSKDVTVYGSDISYAYHQKPGPELEELLKDIPTGTQLSGTGIPADSFIAETYYGGGIYDDSFLPYFEMNAAATETATESYVYAGINIAYLPTIAKGIQYLISGQTTKIVDTGWKSKSIGPVSITKGDDSRLDNKSGMPIWFVKALPRYM